MWSERGVFDILTTTSCTFWTSQVPKSGLNVVCLSHFDFKSASRHNGVHSFNDSTSKSGPALRCFLNGVHFLIAHLAIWLRTCHFSKPPFRPSTNTKHWKTTFRDFSNFSCALIFFLLILSLLTLLSLNPPTTSHHCCCICP